MNKKIGFITDPHFDRVDDEKLEALFDSLNNSDLTHLAITGDICNGIEKACRYIEILEKNLRFSEHRTLYVILGNHEFYGYSMTEALGIMRKFYSGENRRSHWLDISGVIRLDDKHSLVGTSGYPDGLYGNLSSKLICDYEMIADFSHVRDDLDKLRRKLQEIGFHYGMLVRELLEETVKISDNVILTTHVVTFAQAAFDPESMGGGPTKEHALPHFTCKSIADAILEIFSRAENASKNITVVSGHVHGGGHVKIRENIDLYTLPAEYGNPRVGLTIEI